MYCPNCGKDVDAKLKYCSGCGERLLKAAEIDADGTPGKMLDNVLTTIFMVVMFGFGILVGLVAVLLNFSIEPKYVMFIALGYLAAVFGICYQLLTQVPKLIDAKLQPKGPIDTLMPDVQLPPRTTAQLEEPRDYGIGSVTDATTRTLDEVLVERK